MVKKKKKNRPFKYKGLVVKENKASKATFLYSPAEMKKIKKNKAYTTI